ncbi:MAG: SHOCT domain-containing protein [Gammaproteobacteria bacterium]|jgi:hypothetical protein|nr:SHOCT domain-containing protein [Gammaproteobacteria bacterium]
MRKIILAPLRIILLIFVGLSILGCATNTGVIPIGEDSWMVSRQAGSGFSGVGTIKAEAFQEATDFCTAKSKSLQVIGVKEAEPPFINGNWYKAEIFFMCLSKGDEELTHPNLQQEPDTIIEIRAEKDLYAELIKLEDLFKRGIINEEEFLMLKAKLIAN